MKIKTCLSEIFKYFDLFSTTKFLRYKQGQDFKTVSGGIVSLLVVSVFLALFLNTAIQTINKSLIDATSTNLFSHQPLPTNLTFSNSSFMFSVGLMGINLNDPNVRYFDIKMTAFHNGIGGSPIESQSVELVPCTKEHFGIDQQLRDNYESMTAEHWLCPPQNYTYQILGKFTSKEMRYVEVSFNKCDPATDPSRPCVSQSVIDYMILNYGSFMASFFYINPMINPGESEYIGYYIQSKNFLSFTKSLGAQGNAYVQDYQIYTDESLMPFVAYTQEKGVLVTDLFQTVPYQVTNPKYASFNLMKSSYQTIYYRSFHKVDQFFSYVGGLVGTILGLMLFMNKFTSMAYALDLAHKLFKYKQNDQANFKHFNLFSYLVFVPYKVAKFLNCCKHWKEMKKREECMNQVQKQLDISLILRKLNFLQKSIETIFGQAQYQENHNNKEEMLAQVKKRRKLYIIRNNSGNDQNAKVQCSSEEQSEQGEDSHNQSGKKIENTQKYAQNIGELRLNNTDQIFIINEDAIQRKQAKMHFISQQNLHMSNNKQPTLLNGEKRASQKMSMQNIDPLDHEDSILELEQKQGQKTQPQKSTNRFDFKNLDD